MPIPAPNRLREQTISIIYVCKHIEFMKFVSLNAQQVYHVHRLMLTDILWVVVNVPLIADKLGVRVSYMTEEDPGYGIVQDRPEVENPMEENKDTLRVKVTAKPTDKSEITYTHSEWKTQYGFMPGTNIKAVSNGTWRFKLGI